MNRTDSFKNRGNEQNSPLSDKMTLQNEQRKLKSSFEYEFHNRMK